MFKKVCFSAAVAAVLPVLAENGTWTNLGQGTWLDAANWMDGVVAQGADAVATVAAGCEAAAKDERFLTVPAEGVTVGQLVYPGATPDRELRVFGGPLTLAGADPRIAGTDYHNLGIFSTVVSSGGVTLRDMTVGAPLAVRGPVTVEGTLRILGDGGADAPGDAAQDMFPTERLVLGSGAKAAFFSRSASTARTVPCETAAGSPYVRLTGTNSWHGAGSSVSGAGLPAGTFVKRNVNYRYLELSAPAGADGVNDLVFDAAKGGASSQHFDVVEVGPGLATLSAYGYGDVGYNAGNQPMEVSADAVAAPADSVLLLDGAGPYALGLDGRFQGALDLAGKWVRLALRPGDASAAEIPLPRLNMHAGASATLDLPAADKTLRLGHFVGAADSALTKTGPGALELSASTGVAPTVAVKEGRLTLRGPESGLRPVAGAFFHVDASDLSTLMLQEENGTNFVTRWNDADGGAVFATSGTNRRLPYLTPNAQNGRSVVDFGSLYYRNVAPWSDGYGAYMTWSEMDNEIRDVFLVVSDLGEYPPESMRNIVGQHMISCSSTWDFHRGFGRKIVGCAPHAVVSNGRLELDGVASETTGTDLPSGFHLVRIRTTGNARGNRFAGDRDGCLGGQRLAEVLVYNRPLSDEEAAQNTAYLQHKWFSHRALAAQMADGTELDVPAGETVLLGELKVDGRVRKTGGGTLRLARASQGAGGDGLVVEDGEVVFAAEAEARLDAVTAPDGSHVEVGRGGVVTARTVATGGTLAKTGEGTLNLVLLSDGTHAVDVRAGRLALVDDPSAFGAFLHVDVSDAAHRMTSERDGTNFITRLFDVGGNGRYLFPSDYPTCPWIPADRTLNGRPFADLGALKYSSNPDFQGDGRCLFFADAQGMNRVFSTIREVVMVFSDADRVPTQADNAVGAFLLGARGSYHFHRGWNRVLIGPWAARQVMDGRAWIDGTECKGTQAAVPEGFHVIRVQTTANAEAGTVGLDRADQSRGGLRMAELLIFDRPLSDEEGLVVMSALGSKWLGSTPLARATTLSSLSVGKDAVFDFASGEITAQAVSGAGMVASRALALPAGATLTVDTDGETAVPVTATGTLSVADTGTVALSGRGLLHGLRGRTVTLVSAGAVDAPRELRGWKVEGPVGGGYRPKLALTDAGLVLTFSPSGAAVIVR